MVEQTVVRYTYDKLYRLTRAEYNAGRYFAYTYDTVENRLSEEKCLIVPCTTPITTSHEYDEANRLKRVNGVDYTWDKNGNLRNDGTNAYTYDAANRLTRVASYIAAFKEMSQKLPVL